MEQSKSRRKNQTTCTFAYVFPVLSAPGDVGRAYPALRPQSNCPLWLRALNHCLMFMKLTASTPPQIEAKSVKVRQHGRGSGSW